MSDIDYGSAIRRLYWLTLATGVIGIPVAAFRGGVPSAAGFALGAGGALVNLWLWQRVAGKLGNAPPITAADMESAPPPPRGPSATSLTIRVLALFAVAYGIVRALNVNGLAVLCGLLASTLAALVEILYELILLRRG
jgi:hypothetical protein